MKPEIVFAFWAIVIIVYVAAMWVMFSGSNEPPGVVTPDEKPPADLRAIGWCGGCGEPYWSRDLIAARSAWVRSPRGSGYLPGGTPVCEQCLKEADWYWKALADNQKEAPE